ncbi:MAG: MT-A70 family methyltransferase [Myxococcota bacterium]
MKYRTILTDPPWPERGAGKSKRGADRHYSTMTVRDIIELHRSYLGLAGSIPLKDCKLDVQSGCHLWVWTTSNYLRGALDLIDALGFRYVRDCQWVKMKDGKLQIGLGQYLRGAHEPLLLATRGPACVPEPHGLPSVLLAPRTRHSRKPDESYAMIERVSPGPRLEMFSTRERDGWQHHGDRRWVA